MTARKRSFEDEWPALAADLKRFLARKGVSKWQAEDLVQETGLRLFKMWGDVDFLRSPRGLAYTIAQNLLWDERNRKSGQEVVGDIPERACNQDVETAGLARLELGRVRRAMTSMTPQQRTVLLAEIDHEVAPAGSAPAIKMVRMRARRKLNNLLETAPASAFAPLLALKAKVWRTFSFVRRNSTFIEIPTATFASVAGAMVLLILPGTASPAPKQVSLTLTSPLRAAVQARAEIARSAERLAYATTGSTSATTDRSKSAGPPKPRSTDETDAYVQFGGEGQPVEGDAAIDLRPDEDPHDAPGCEVEPAENGATYSCEAEAGGQEVHIDGGIELRP